jgi:hypothetical protein
VVEAFGGAGGRTGGREKGAHHVRMSKFACFVWLILMLFQFGPSFIFNVTGPSKPDETTYDCSYRLLQGMFVADACYYYGDKASGFVPSKNIKGF